LKEGYSYSVINSYRSALNLILQIDDNGKRFVGRFLKGVRNIRPPEPKYSITRNPQPVLQLLASYYPLESLTLEVLSWKLVSLISLFTAHRLQTLSVITMQDILILRDQNRVNIQISTRIKTSGPRKIQPKFVLPYFTDSPELCVASTLEYYIP